MYIIRIIDTILSDKRLQKTRVAAPVAATISRQDEVAGEDAAGRSGVERRRVGVVMGAEANWRLLSRVLDAGRECMCSLRSRETARETLLPSRDISERDKREA
jgi:hypothetical protein